MRAAELRGRFIQFGTTNPVDDRIVQAPLNSLQNAIKVRRKELDALNDGALLTGKTEAEEELRASAHLAGTDQSDAQVRRFFAHGDVHCRASACPGSASTIWR